MFEMRKFNETEKTGIDLIEFLQNISLDIIQHLGSKDDLDAYAGELIARCKDIKDKLNDK